jgi:tetratricopeptide (TPR) repeat protein
MVENNIELGRALFRLAIEAVGEDAYLYQQFGIFEMNCEGGDLDMAEQNLKQARRLASFDRSIRHSVANLARRQAVEASNPLVREHYRKKAREELSGLIGSQAKTPHGYSTAVQLGIDELRELLQGMRDQEPDRLIERQIVDISQRIENSLADGFQKFPNTPHLLTLETEYRDLLSQDRRAEAALRKAFEGNPRLDWIAVRLAKRLIRSARVQEAKEIFLKCLSANPSSRLVHFEIGKIYTDSADFKEKNLALSHFERSFISGDGNYDAQFWYARELFISGQEERAKEIFFRLGIDRVIVKKCCSWRRNERRYCGKIHR